MKCSFAGCTVTIETRARAIGHFAADHGLSEDAAFARADRLAAADAEGMARDVLGGGVDRSEPAPTPEQRAAARVDPFGLDRNGIKKHVEPRRRRARAERPRRRVPRVATAAPAVRAPRPKVSRAERAAMNLVRQALEQSEQQTAALRQLVRELERA